MKRENSVQITEEGIRYARGVHIVSRRPDLNIISVNSQGEIVREHRYPTGSPDGAASPRVVALIETVELLNQIQLLREMEPWAPEIPFFIPPYETPEAEATAVGYLKALMGKVFGTEENPTARGVHVDVEHDLDGILVLYAMTSRGQRIAERHWNLNEDEGEKLEAYKQELNQLLDENDPEV
jgi:hypothetical protein